jgi:tetratricopeptide (TPR) repeat protein
MGSVYEAYDHERQSTVAIKVARETSAPWLYRLKQEFRALAGIVHPNLVTLHELIECEGQWLFTMERVPGLSFHEARRSAGAMPTTSRAAALTGDDTAGAVTPSRRSESEPLLSNVDEIGDAICQLCDGLDFLHQSGLAHGDMKPSNALITPDGRVVILDFGIARNWKLGDDEGTDPLVGTPGYMAPERLSGEAATPASDMYAVGVMLFEALSGHDFSHVADPESTLRAARPSLPGDEPASARRRLLEGLSLRLIDPDAGMRPTAAEARDAVAGNAVRRAPASAPGLDHDSAPRFVARQSELERVRNLLLDLRPTAPRVVLISGESGIGKTELMRRVVDEQMPAGCIVLEGKCYEREHVSYRALDRVIDVLSSRLMDVEREEILALAWSDLAIVASMFPVLLRVPEIDRVCGQLLRSEDRDPVAKRRAAARMLGRLMVLAANGRQVVVYIDDLQWGDEESATLLRDLLQQEGDLTLKFVGGHRHPVSDSHFVSALLDGEPPVSHAEVSIGALSRDESAVFARLLLGANASTDHVMRIADEANGNPFLIRELVSFGRGRDQGELELRSAVARHVDLLSQHARIVLEILAVAARRLHVDVVREATGIGQTLEAAVILLRSQHLIKTSDRSGTEIEPYHDRIREVIVQQLAPKTIAARHAALAEAMEELGKNDPAVLAFHLEGAGENERAGEAALRAAELAEASLAHLNAAKLYAKAVELLPESDPRRRESLHALARTLSAAGRAASAAPVYMDLASTAEPDEALKLRRSAAEAWVYSGDFENARRVLPEVLRASGVREARTRPGALIGILSRQLWLWRRGHRYEPVHEADIEPDRLVRIDAYENACELWSTIDLIRAYHAHLSHVRESLEAGEPRRVARALVEAVVGKSIAGRKVSEKAHELLRVASEASRMGDFTEEQALIRYATAVHSALNGRYADVVATAADLSDAPALKRTVRQLRTLRSVLGYSRWWLGQWPTMCSEYKSWILDAFERGDQLSVCSFRLEQGGCWEDVLKDEPERALARVAHALDSAVGRELAFGHLSARQSKAWIALYMGRPEEAIRLLRFKGAEKAFLRVQRSRVEISILHAQAEIARGRAGLHRARRWMHEVEKERVAWTSPVLRLMTASIAEIEGRRYEGIAGLRVAISECNQLGYEMFSAAATSRLGELLGDEEGEAMRRAAQQRIAQEGARRPDRIVRTLAPGFADPLG